jgi:hypothetical protein
VTKQDASALLDEPLPIRHRGPQCTVSRWLNTFDDESRRRLAALIDNPEGPQLTAVYERMKDTGCPRVYNLRRHRRRIERSGDFCTCSPDEAL